MNLNTVLKRIPHWYEAGVRASAGDQMKCVYLTSPPGLGKTTTLSKTPEMIAQATGKEMGLVIINGPLLNPPDSIGYLMPREVEGHLESLFSDPFWFRTREGKRLEEYDGGIILVDEADKMDVDVKKIIGEAALSGRLGPHQLPNGWLVWMAGNRAEDRSGSTKELDHLINRRMEISITADIDSWSDWCVTNGVMPLTIAFGKQYSQIVFPDKAPEKQGPFCTPRSMVMADGYIQTLMESQGGELPNDPTAVEEITGMIGPGAAAQYFTFIKLEREMPKFSAIIKDPKGVKVPSKPDAQMLICYNLAHRVDDTTVTSVIAYIERMPKEFAVTFAKAAAKRVPLLVVTPAFHKWTLENASLMAAIAA